ncbi:hypothetical protein OG225_42005 (plasmid) [Nocardia sp. NBC_01377]|uniref:hypothetical protein n=1 Tax=Nocardia sp. NBC_01377 TaxID=2903595 RepID=UPI002F91479A
MMRIVGTYHTALHRDVDAFQAIDPILCLPVISNAEYTLGKVTETSDGQRVVHQLNINHLDGVFPWPRGLGITEGHDVVLEYIEHEGLPALIRFCDRDEGDVSLWRAVRGPDQRWRIEGDEGPVEWSYRDNELEFVGERDIPRTRRMR